VGKSHWIGDFAHGEFSKEHGTMTRTLATMFMKLCERYATRSNWRGYCVDTETEALTQRGWLRENEITEDDTILSYENNDLTWSKIKSIYRGEFDGLMHKLTNRGIDALITPGHKIVTNRGLVPVEYLLQSDKIIMLGNPVKTNNEPKYSNSMVELLGWILAEGNYQPKKQLVTIYQNEGVYADRIRVCLNTLNFKFSESTGRKNISFLLNRPASNKIFSILPVKNLSMEFILDLTSAQRELLINTMVDGDGWSRSSGWSYTQKDETHVDLFQALCAISGHKTNSHFATHKSFGKQVSYFNINKFASNTTNVTSIDFHGGSRNGRGLIGRGKATHPNQPTTHYTGIVWCPETEYGCFVARRAGKVYLTGNTYNEEMRGQALLQLSQIGLQFDESKSQNPFAYYTAAITNSFTRILNLEKKNQNIRDDMLEQAGLNPSWTRQNAGKKDPNFGAVVVVTSGDDIVQ
jgi:ribonucleoside-triphosphate reductase